MFIFLQMEKKSAEVVAHFIANMQFDSEHLIQKN